MKKINYDKLNERIVEQAYHNSGLTAAQLTELYRAKLERAQALLVARQEFERGQSRLTVK